MQKKKKMTTSDENDLTDAVIVSSLGRATRDALESKRVAELALADAIDSAYKFGHEVGKMDLSNEIIAWIEENRSTFDFEGFHLRRDHFNSDDLVEFIKKLNA